MESDLAPAFLAVIVLTLLQVGRVLASSQSAGKKSVLLLACFAVIGLSVNQALFLTLELPSSSSAETAVQGKVAVVTGCTPGGIGYATALQLAQWNAARVICTVRSDAKGQQLGLPSNVQYRVVELDDFDSVRRFVDNELKEPVDVLVLNAGLGTDTAQLTTNGFEQMYQVNHLSHFLLVRLLIARGLLGPNSRTIFVSSTASLGMGKVDRQAYGQAPGGRLMASSFASNAPLVKNVFGTYADTKLMQIAAAKALTTRFTPQAGVFVSACPGFVATNFQDHLPAGDLLSKAIKLVTPLVGRTPAQGAARVLQLAGKPLGELVPGKFYDSYIPLPLPLDMTQSNVEWVYETSSKLVQPWM